MSPAARVCRRHWPIISPSRECSRAPVHLTDSQRASSEVAGMRIFVAGHGFGMGVAVVLEPEKATPTLCGGGVGAVGWPGGFGGWWRADPGDNSVMIFLTRNMLELDQCAKGIGFAVYGAITEFQVLARTSPR